MIYTPYLNGNSEENRKFECGILWEKVLRFCFVSHSFGAAAIMVKINSKSMILFESISKWKLASYQQKYENTFFISPLSTWFSQSGLKYFQLEFWKICWKMCFLVWIVYGIMFNFYNSLSQWNLIMKSAIFSWLTCIEFEGCKLWDRMMKGTISFDCNSSFIRSLKNSISVFFHSFYIHFTFQVLVWIILWDENESAIDYLIQG